MTGALLRRIGPWLLSNVAVVALLVPWMIYSLPGAVSWGVETKYTAQQYGAWAKACYLPLTFCLGETVHPLNLWVVLPAFLGFGAAMVAGVYIALRRGRALPVFLCLQAAALYLTGLCFAAASTKHLLIVTPAWCGLLAIGMARRRAGWLARVCGIVILATTCASLFNYFTGRQFADADMVTPWREMTAQVERSEQPGDLLIIGYRPDRGVLEMFARYYRGKLRPECLYDSDDEQEAVARRTMKAGTTWLLLHESDPWQETESAMKRERTAFEMTPWQEEEHTLKGLHEGGLRGIHKYRSPLYRLYRIHGKRREIGKLGDWEIGRLGNLKLD